MKFGEYLQTNTWAAWQAHYLDYDELKHIIKVLEEQQAQMNSTEYTTKVTSLTVPPQTNASGMPILRQHSPSMGGIGDLPVKLTQEDFYKLLEKEMAKIENFTKAQVKLVRVKLSEVESQLARGIKQQQSEGGAVGGSEHDALLVKVGEAGELFLRLEKYVNLNFMGFHKILKKHDRRLPNPCKAFYVGRLYEQSWVRGDFSDVFVKISQLYSTLRGDDDSRAEESSRQDFVRSTRKYWVHMEDISQVKYVVLQHLPVLLQKSMGGETDSQLVNSVYIDNYAMELYHGRLDKTPGAIALRFRWYGTGTPDTVFVERKTHREKWAQEISVKERFVVQEPQVLPLLRGEFNIAAEEAKMRSKGKVRETTLCISFCSLRPSLTHQSPPPRTSHLPPLSPTHSPSILAEGGRHPRRGGAGLGGAGRHQQQAAAPRHAHAVYAHRLPARQRRHRAHLHRHQPLHDQRTQRREHAGAAMVPQPEPKSAAE